MDDVDLSQYYNDLPTFANEENKKLHESIKKEFAELDSLKTECNDLNERVAVLREHFQNIIKEVESSEKFARAKSLEVEEEKHLKKVNERELGRIKTDRETLEKNTKDLDDRCVDLEGRMITANLRIEEFRKESEENEEQLRIFQELAAQKEDDRQAILKYQFQDEKQISKLIEKVEKSSNALFKKKKELEAEVTNTKSLQIELDEMAGEFRKIHEGRIEMLEKWEQSLNRMKEINESIEKVTKVYEERKKTVETCRRDVADSRRELEAAENENKDLEKKIEFCESKVLNANKKLEDDESQLREFNETVNDARGKLSSLESDEKFRREEISNIREKTQKEEQKKISLNERLALTEDAMSTQQDNTTEYNNQIKLIDEVLKDQKTTLNNIENSIEDEKRNHYLISNDINNLKNALQTSKAEYNGTKSRIFAIESKINQYDEELQKQNQTLYNAKYVYLALEKKINHVTYGTEIGEVRDELEEKLHSLEETNKEKIDALKRLDVQLANLDMDIRQAKLKNKNLEVQNKELAEELNDIEIDVNTLNIAVSNARKSKEDVVVNLNMLRLREQRLRDSIDKKSNEIISLENRKQQLGIAAQERMLELDEHIAALKIQLKGEEEAKHEATVELSERKKHEQTFNTKYSIVMKYIGQEEDSKTSREEILLQSSREKDRINERGNQLEQEIKKSLTELKALERATTQLNNMNNNLKGNRRKLTKEEENHIAVLKETVRRLQKAMKAKMEEALNVAAQKKSKEDAFTETQQKIEKDQMTINELNNKMERVNKEHIDLMQRVSVAGKIFQSELKKNRAKENVDPKAAYPATLLEKNIEIKFMKWNLENAADQMITLAESYPEIEPQVRLAMTQLGIKFRPHIPTLKPHMPSSGSTLSSPRFISNKSSPKSSRSGASFRTRMSYPSCGSINSARSTGARVSLQLLRFN